MITSTILNVLFQLLSTLLTPFTYLPVATLDVRIVNALTATQEFYATVATILPYAIASFFIILGILIGIEVAILTYKATMWLIKKIPGLS